MSLLMSFSSVLSVRSCVYMFIFARVRVAQPCEQLDADPSVDFLDYEPSASSAATTSDTGGPFGPLGGAPTLQLVKLRNPNGHAGWQGPWSYTCGAGGTFHSDDARWTRSRRAALKLGADDGGVFWMG